MSGSDVVLCGFVVASIICVAGAWWFAPLWLALLTTLLLSAAVPYAVALLAMR